MYKLGNLKIMSNFNFQLINPFKTPPVVVQANLQILQLCSVVLSLLILPWAEL